MNGRRLHDILLAAIANPSRIKMRKLSTLCVPFVVLLVAVLGCKQLANVGDVNLFQGDNAAKAAAAIKSKEIGRESCRERV